MLRYKFRALSIIFLLGTTLLLLRGPAAAQAGNSAPAAVAALSPEEAAVSLLPYRLSAQDALPGYTVGSSSTIDTAVTNADSDSSPWDAFNTWQRAGLLVRYDQTLIPDAHPAGSPANALFQRLLFADAASAAAFATGRSVPLLSSRTLSYEPVSLKAPLGEASAAWHVTLDLQALAGALGLELTANAAAVIPAVSWYEIHWQRGQLAFALDTAPGNEQQADAESLAAAIDAVERTRPALSLGSATVTPPASEAQRLEAGRQLRSFLAGMGTPDGYFPEGVNLEHPAQFVEEEPDPVAALHKVDEQWKRVVAADQDFTSAHDSSVTLSARAALDADPQAAKLDMADYIVHDPRTVAAIDAPVQLGDATAAFRSTGPDRTGKPADDIYIGWTHGALLLGANMYGPAGSTSMDQLVTLAQQVEARFQAASPPTSGPPLTLGAGWNLVAGTGQILLGDGFGPGIYTFQPGDSAYQASSGHTLLRTGFGYWVQASGDGPVPLRAGSSTPYQVQAPAGQPFLIGNPNGTQPALVTGADTVLTYDPVDGYRETTRLKPGEGAWVVSNAGGTITVTPQGASPAASAAGFQTISSSKGYSFTVPSGWQQERPPADLKDVDLVADSLDDGSYAFVTTIAAQTGSSINVLRVLRGGLVAIQAGDQSRVTIVEPSLVTREVPGADNAAYAVSTYAGSRTGRTHVEIDVAANRNETLYVFTIDVSTDSFDENQEQVWQIANSLQLAASATP